MGQLALAAKITHVPSMYLSEQPGPRHGTRQDAIDGHREISRRCRELGIFIALRYFVTVRRATVMPHLPSSITRSSSLKGASFGSAWMIS